MICLRLFLSFMQIGCFCFGGGYAAMPLIEEQVVTANHWLTMNAFSDLVTIAEMTPGPIAINAATFVGTQVAGPAGAVAATCGYIFPSCLFVTLLAYVYTRFRNLSLIQQTLASLRPAVVALIAKAGIGILIAAFFVNGTFSLAAGNVSFRMILYFAAALVLLRKAKLNPILVMVLCGAAEVIFYCAGTLIR